MSETTVDVALTPDLLDALEDAIELAEVYHRPVTAENLRRVRGRLRDSLEHEDEAA